MKYLLFVMMFAAATAKGVDHPVDYAKGAVEAVQKADAGSQNKTEEIADSAISETESTEEAAEGSGDEASSGEIDVPDSCGDLYTITCYGKPGWFMLNKDFTDGEWKKVTSGTKQEKVHNEWIDKGAKYNDGVATIDGRWLIACTPKFGTVGDKITFTLADGTELPCIMADEKGADAGNEWGHENGRCLLELEVDKDYFFKYGNPGSDEWHPELKQKVVKAVNETQRENEKTEVSDNKEETANYSDIKFSTSCYGKQGYYALGDGWKTVASGTTQEQVHNEWVAKGAKYNDGIAMIGDRYLVACSATVGNKISITLADGTVIPCIVADEMSPNGIQFEINRDKYLEYGGSHPGSRFWKPKWNQKVKSIEDEGALELEANAEDESAQSTTESVSSNNNEESSTSESSASSESTSSEETARSESSSAEEPAPSESTAESAATSEATASSQNSDNKLPYINQGLGVFNPDTGEWEHQDWPDTVVHGEKPLRSVGCGYCATAMACSYLTGSFVSPFDIDADRTSESLCAWANNNGVKAHNTASWNEVYQALKDGHPVMALVRNKVGTRKDDPTHGYWTNQGHFILMYGLTDDGLIKVNDSGCADNTYCISGDGHDPAIIYQNASGYDPDTGTKDSQDADYTIFGV